MDKRNINTSNFKGFCPVCNSEDIYYHDFIGWPSIKASYKCKLCSCWFQIPVFIKTKD